MKTSYPEWNRKRFIIVNADDYAQYVAAQKATSYHPTPIHMHSRVTHEERAVEQLGVRIGVATIEVFMGRRPLHHLSAWMTPGCLRAVGQKLERAQIAIAEYHYHYPRVDPHRKPRQIRPRRIIVQRVAPTAYEMSLLVTDGFRTRAIALRAEKKRKRWKIVTLAIA
ncbi:MULTISPECIES: Rv3235 family protein [Rothia]|uniref:Uncharacterized protein n=1 Tax=Rothia nasimurium TaxID=85336 RepID=A0A1Y1RPM8_9MICC|nr:MULTISPECIES: Rv3235 family protein [Rothia]ORC18862.1 hypothetical protein A7979_02365 [Rothia nasimurium]